MLFVINLFFHILTSVLYFTFLALEELIILTGLSSIIYFQVCCSVISVSILMSIADHLAVLFLSFPFVILNLDLTNYIHFCCGFS